MIIAAIVFILSIGGAAAVSVAQDPYSEFNAVQPTSAPLAAHEQQSVMHFPLT